MKAFNMKRRYTENIIALLSNLLLVYCVYFVARVTFMLVNLSYFKEGMTFSHLLTMYKGGLLFDTTAIIYTNALYIVMMLFPLWLKEQKWYHQLCKWLFVIINSCTMVINLADAVYFPYTLRRTTTSVFKEFNNENNLAGVIGTELINHWYLVLIGIILIALMWKLYLTPKMMHTDYHTRGSRLKYGGAHLLALCVAVPLCIGGCRGGLQSGVRPITISNANQYVNRPTECALVLNTPFSLIRTIGKSVFVVPDYFQSEEELSAVFTPIHNLPVASPQAMADTTRQAPHKKNVVIIIVESFGREYIGSMNTDLENGKYKGYTPNVDKLVEKSVFYRYSFCNGHKSIDGMPSVLCGIPMFIEPFVLTPSSMNTYTSIAGLLSKWGYDTAFFHGANRGSMGFLAFANKIGFQNYYGRQDYDADPRFGGDKDFDGNWGIWDEPFLQYFCTKMGEMHEPFMTSVFTVSSHHPFVVPEQYKNIYKEEHLPIHKCIRYTDMAIGKFFESASKQPWFKNTIFVLTSDHTNQSDHAAFLSDLGGFSSPIIIYDPSGEIEPGMREGIAQQIDIVPTVLGVLGYDKPYLSFGIDLFNTPTEETFTVNYHNGIYQYAKNGYVIQFDGQKTKAVYALTDRLMQHNLVNQVPEQAAMEREVKAIIQQYMQRMVHDQLMP